MKIFLSIVVLILGLILAASWVPAAQCKWCPRITCFNSAICHDCFCMSRDYSGGTCVSIDHVEPMLEDGYSFR